ncbi:MAG TPA: phospholipase D family protein [Acidiphilium sp.]|nr:phospholipase D family protein [Acidiphilium sp.]
MHDRVSPTDFFGVYAYATSSGVASFELEFGQSFWLDAPSRWLFGLDYGRTQPQALRRIIQKPNTEVKIVDGAWIVEQEGFLPRRDFHAKLALLRNPQEVRFGMVVGSGNFSSNGLKKSLEGGAVIYVDNKVDYNKCLSKSFAIAKGLWKNATPAEEVLSAYEERWTNSFSRGVAIAEDGIFGPRQIFWIEAGYVTKNRGEFSPGNQIDLPRGMSRFFGFNPDRNLPLNSIIGAVTFLTPVGGPITRNLRLGNNQMEKITLPIPETHGFDIYDGKVLVFQTHEDGFKTRALEGDDFESAFGDRLKDVRVMGSGRRYGYIE